MLAFYDVVSRFYIATLRRSRSIEETSRIANPFTGPPSRKRSYSVHQFASIVILSDVTQRGRNAKLIRLIRTNGQANDAHFLSISGRHTSAIYTAAINKLYDGEKKGAVNLNKWCELKVCAERRTNVLQKMGNNDCSCRAISKWILRRNRKLIPPINPALPLLSRIIINVTRNSYRAFNLRHRNRSVSFRTG